MTDKETINNLRSLAIDLLHTNVLVLEGYCAASDQKLYLSLNGLEGLKDVWKNSLDKKVEEKETEISDNQPFIIFRDFEFSICT